MIRYRVTITPEVGKPHSSLHKSCASAQDYCDTWERHFCTYTIDEITLPDPDENEVPA